MSFTQELNLTSLDSTFYQISNKVEKYFSELKETSNYGNPVVKEKFFDRWKWFWEIRVDEKGGFKKYGEQLNKIAGQDHVLKSLSTITWTPLGPDSIPYQASGCGQNNNGMCQVASVWADETDLYVGLNGGGLWRRNLSSWTNLTDDYPCLSVNDIAVDNNGKIYVATGMHGQSHSLHAHCDYGFGVYYSTDGEVWVTDAMTIEPNEDFFIVKVKIHPIQQNIIYALSRKTVYKSINGGEDWEDMDAPPLINNQYYRDIIFKEGKPDTVFICSDGWNHLTHKYLIEGGDIYKSINGGVTWDDTNLAENLKYSANSLHSCCHLCNL